MGKLLFVAILLFSSSSYSAQHTNTGWFKISEIFVSSGTNMHFRVVGLPTGACPNGSNWAYIDEIDSGAKGKISTLLSAFATGINVQLWIETKDYYSNGEIFCQIVELSVTK